MSAHEMVADGRHQDVYVWCGAVARRRVRNPIAQHMVIEWLPAGTLLAEAPACLSGGDPDGPHD
ncbi:hypothetical protein B9W68_01965 [Streptomyces sp. CS227]|uniref:hypothetical protein n=1 Tax=Streptomyces sp. CS227 TaxID=1982763 RepID=UPI000B41FB04|nr:hypothetical protein [Streptomyces sp. CS227]OWA19279.1 hypothetical protein B9W68_01965 [Streptomyces sp. CS227]